MKRRIFIAINLPTETKELIRSVVKELKKFDWPVRWETPEKWHLTLRFLGSITEDELKTISAIVSRSVKDINPFILKIKDFYILPEINYPRIISLKIEENETLFKLRSAIAGGIEEEGIGEPERHDFFPHITVGRTPPIRANYSYLLKKKFSADFPVSSVEIMESKLQSEGSEYKIIESIKIFIN